MPSAAPGAAVHPAMFASMNGNSSTHSTRVRLRDVRPPQAYASITGPGRSAAAAGPPVEAGDPVARDLAGPLVLQQRLGGGSAHTVDEDAGDPVPGSGRHRSLRCDRSARRRGVFGVTAASGVGLHRQRYVSRMAVHQLIAGPLHRWQIVVPRADRSVGDTRSATAAVVLHRRSADCSDGGRRCTRSIRAGRDARRSSAGGPGAPRPDGPPAGSHRACGADAPGTRQRR